jgi:heme-degrading monooxygenase HmoA
VPGSHIVQVNIARLREPLDSPRLADFVAALDPVNALADSSPGFVWRLQTEDGDATAIRAFDDDMLIVNMSVWESIDHLAAFTYGGEHREVLRRRRDWFERIKDAYAVLWWVPAGYRPTVEDARSRLDLLRRMGPTPDAFTFRVRYGPDGLPDDESAPEGWLCPT